VPLATTIFEGEVVRIEDLSPTFRRITLGGPGMADYGFSHHPLDQRFKLIIPPGGGDPVFDAASFIEENAEGDFGWYKAWLQIDEDLRGTMRTYTVRDWRDAERELVVDMVLHTDEDGHSGPAAQWAMDARVGSKLHLVGPSRHAPDGRGAIAFEPGGARELLIAGDETAVPAIASILEHLADVDDQRADGGVRGRALLEVPTADDVLDVRAPKGMEVVFLPREGKDVGALLRPAVEDAVRADPVVAEETAQRSAAHAAEVELEDVDIETGILWDVPVALTTSAHGSTSEIEQGDRPFYAWIAGESAIIKGLRRYLVREVGVDRKQVAFMGYWRIGKAEG
jgi:iron complex transport system ATP-binding protein